MAHGGLPAVTGTGGNRILAALRPADFDLLARDLQTVALEQDTVLVRAGEPAEYVFFPHSGAVSLMVDMANGQTVATATTGREGAVAFADGALWIPDNVSDSSSTSVARLDLRSASFPSFKFEAKERAAVPSRSP